MRYLLILYVGLLSSYSFGQGFQGKFIAGFNAAQIDGDREWGYNKFGFLGGGAACFPFSKKLGLQLEIVYSGKGAASASVNRAFLDTRLHYIDFPLILNIKIKPRITIQPGVNTGYFLSGRMDNTGFGYYLNLDNYIKRYDIALCLGGEFALDDRWAINARFNYSAISIEKPIFFSTNRNVFPYGGWSNNFITFSLRYTFLNPPADLLKK